MSSRAFVAYHNFARMGCAYAERKGDGFTYRSNKSRQFLERALGQDVWVIEGRRDATGATRYGLAARFLPEEVVPASEGCILSGEEGKEFDPPVPLAGFDWFEELIREQESPGFGFNEIQSRQVIEGLAAIESAPAAEPTPAPSPAPAVPDPKPAEAQPAAPLDNAGRLALWLRQRRGRYFCNHCLSRETGIAPVAQMNPLLRPLQKAPKEWRYGDAPCAGCGRERKCIAYVG